MAWILDTSHSSIEFSVKHMMITSVRGRFNEFNGTLTLDQQNPARSVIEGTVNVASIDTQNADRDTHLRSPDFFDAANYPTMSFRSTRIEPKGDDEFRLHGDLTIKGNTRPVVFDVTLEGQGKDPWGNQRLGFTAKSTVNRKDFGLTWNVALETGGVLVGEDVKISVEMQVIQQQEAPVPA